MDQALLQMTLPSSVALWECSEPRGEHMSNKRFGYARVSTTDQNEDRQVLELLESGIEERDIYVDKQSGRSFERTNYLALRNTILRKGDVLVVKSIDRFGRNYSAIRAEWEFLTKTLGVDIVVLDTPICRASSEHAVPFLRFFISSFLFSASILILGVYPFFRPKRFPSCFLRASASLVRIEIRLRSISAINPNANPSTLLLISF